MKLAASLLIAASLAGQDHRDDALMRARTMAQTLDRMDDNRLAVSGLARLGSVVCRYDYETARYVFQTGASRQQRAGNRGSLVASKELMASAVSCDEGLAAEMAARVAIRKPRIEWLEDEIRAAREDLEDEEGDPIDAAARAERAIPFLCELSGDGQEDFVAFLIALRLEQEELADHMFGEALRYMRFDPAGSLWSLFVLGNYLYTSPKGDLTLVDLGVWVYDLRVPRPESAPDTARFFLEAAGDALDFRADHPDDRALRFLLAHQLIPHVDFQARHLADQYQTSLDQATADVPQELIELAAGQLQPITDLDARDVGPPEPFDTIRRYLQQGEVETAFALVREVRSPLKRALLYLGFAGVALDGGDEIGFARMLQLAAREHDGAPVRLRPWLWTAHAGLQASIDADGAFIALTRAVETWKDGYLAGAAIRPSALGFIERVGPPGRGRHFLLWVPGVDHYTLADVLPAFGLADVDRVDSILAGLNNPDRRIEAQIAALAVRLENAVTSNKAE